MEGMNYESTPSENSSRRSLWLWGSGKPTSTTRWDTRGPHTTTFMKGIEFLRKLYADARLSIRPQPRSNKVDLLRQMARTVGASPEEIAEALAAMAEPHRIHATPQERENDEIQALTKVFVDKIRTGSKAAP